MRPAVLAPAAAGAVLLAAAGILLLGFSDPAPAAALQAAAVVALAVAFRRALPGGGRGTAAAVLAGATGIASTVFGAASAAAFDAADAGAAADAWDRTALASAGLGALLGAAAGVALLRAAGATGRISWLGVLVGLPAVLILAVPQGLLTAAAALVVGPLAALPRRGGAARLSPRPAAFAALGLLAVTIALWGGLSLIVSPSPLSTTAIGVGTLTAPVAMVPLLLAAPLPDRPRAVAIAAAAGSAAVGVVEVLTPVGGGLGDDWLLVPLIGGGGLAVLALATLRLPPAPAGGRVLVAVVVALLAVLAWGLLVVSVGLAPLALAIVLLVRRRPRAAAT